MRLLLKKVLPRKIIFFLVQKKERLVLFFLNFAQKNRLLSDFYYLIANGFSNEHQAVLKGRKAYYDSLKDIGESCALLRRNIHRLEKGLIMRPRRNIFAEGFIQETVDCYKDAMKSKLLAGTEKKWATDVLDEYFEVVGFTIVTDKARETYVEARNQAPFVFNTVAEFPSVDQKFKPYAYKSLPELSINFDELKSLFIRRRSVRWYTDEAVPLELVQKAANIASFAPSACNRQPYRFLFCNEKEKAVDIASCAGGTTGFADNLPSIVAVVGDLSAYPYERDRHLIYIDGSLAAMQLMLALETLGLSTCTINWPEVDVSERKIRKIIKLKDYERIVMLLAVGYADNTGGIPYSQKKENNLILENISK